MFMFDVNTPYYNFYNIHPAELMAYDSYFPFRPSLDIYYNLVYESTQSYYFTPQALSGRDSMGGFVV